MAMEAVPRLPMISFELKTSPENAQFGPALKQYIANFYNEDPESYNTEISNLEALRCAAVRPSIDVAGCQLLKKYYCQLHFLKSRFPMHELHAAAVYFAWKDPHSNVPCSIPDIRFELMSILCNIGALHTQLGAIDSRSSPDGLKMACTHFQCAAWAYQTVKETYHEIIPYTTSLEVIQFMQQVCFAQAQECILEKSMMDNRKATITAKVAVQVVEHYKKALSLLSHRDSTSFNNIASSKTVKEWSKYLSFKVTYHKCIALLFQGQQAEEQQKMGERVAFYQAACEQLEEARKLSAGLNQQKDLMEAIAFTSDVVEGKRKAARNENEFIYHEEVPERHALQEVKGASLVKGIAFNVNDIEVSGPDIFARLVPMEAHEAASLYSEKKAQTLRRLVGIVESKDQELAEFMSSLQLDVFTQMRQATGLSQDLIDRAAALSAKPSATQDLVATMGKLSNSYHEVESMLNEIQELLKEEEQSEKQYQEMMGKRPPSIIATDLSREAAKYREAHSKANESNQNLHKAMMTHVANLKILAQPLSDLQKQIPAVELPNPNIDENSIKEIETLISKVEEMRNQRAMLLSQFREAIHKDDITAALVTRQADQPLDQLFRNELQKHDNLTGLIEQNVAAQENILKAFVDAYARSMNTRRYLQDVIAKRSSIVAALITSFDSYEDLLSKANKGIDFYNKLETNVSKLLQRIKSAFKVQQEEREQMLMSSMGGKEEVAQPVSVSSAPKLKDFIDTRKKSRFQDVNYYPANVPDAPSWPPAVRPAPLGSEINDPIVTKTQEPGNLDQILSERMSALKTGSNYSYTDMNSPSANKAFTVTTNTYQPISSSTQEIGTSDANSGYNYQNYMGYTAANMTNACSQYGYEYGQVAYGNYNQGSYAQSNSDYAQGYVPNKNQPNVGYPQPTQQVDQNPQNYMANQGFSYMSEAQPGIPYSQPELTPIGYPTNIPSVISTTNLTQPTVSASYMQISNSNTNLTQPTVPYMQNPNCNTNLTQPPYMQDPNSTTTLTQPTVSASYMQNANTYPPASGYSQQSLNNIAPNSYSNQPPVTTYEVPYPAPVSYSHDQSLSNVSNQAPVTYASYAQPQNVYYPTGYAPGSPQVAPDQSHNTPQTFGSMEYATSVRPDISSISLNSTYSSPAIDIKSSNSSGTNYMMSNGQNYPSYSTAGQYDYYYNYATAETVVPKQQCNETVAVVTKESNVDLLTGLDFTVNQAPLVPQQKAVPEVKPQEKEKSDPKPVLKEELLTPKIEKAINRKSLNNSEVKKLFEQELEKFEKFVDVLPNKTLNGPTNLDLKWKEITDKQDLEKKAISVARCYPMKNRYPDILPYDRTRVELKDSKDDYINASYIKEVSHYSAPLIVTQAPLASTIADFWTMIKEQQVELIVSLMSDSEFSGDIYWPLEKGRDLAFQGMVISLFSVTVKPHWVERLISVQLPEKRDSRVLMHLQFTSWPGSLFPTNPEAFVGFVTEATELFQQQRSTWHPVVVQCSAGIGRSGLMCLLMSAILEANNSKAMPDFVSLAVKISACRRNALRDREHLKFAYEGFLAYMRQVSAQGQIKRIASDGGMLADEKTVPHEPEDNDPLNSLDPFWASKK